MSGGILASLVNAAVGAILRSRLHGLLGRSLVLLTFTGRRTGRRRTIPVMYAEGRGAIVVVAGRPGRKRWWRNLRGGAPVTLRLRGDEREGLGEVVGDAEAVAEAKRTYLARFPGAARWLDGAEQPVVVRIRLAARGQERGEPVPSERRA